jgi:hypothetical protein
VQAIRELWAAGEAFERAGRAAHRAVATGASASMPAARGGSGAGAPDPSATVPPSGNPAPPPASAVEASGTGTALPPASQGAYQAASEPASGPPAALPSVPSRAGTGDAGETRAAQEAAIRQSLRAYEAAWESLDLEALRGVQRLSGAEADLVGQTMAAARQYAMQVTVRDIALDPGGRRASVVCRIAREFHPRIGRVSRQTVTSTLELERRDTGWIIVAVR